MAFGALVTFVEVASRYYSCTAYLFQLTSPVNIDEHQAPRAGGLNALPEAHAFHHEALFYADEDEYLARTVPFVAEGVDGGEAVLVAVAADKQRLLKGALASRAAGVRFADMATMGRNPARIIPVWRDFVGDEMAVGRQVRGIGEPIWPGRSDSELVECHLHESLLNLAFAGGPGWQLLCPYDSAALGPEVLDAARATHPVVSEGGAAAPSAAYAPDARAYGPLDGPLAEPLAPTQEMRFDVNRLQALRALVREEAGGAGMDPTRMCDLTLAVGELASNSIRHAGGSGLARMWSDSGAFYVEVSDAGRIFDPLVGRATPTATQTGGRGVWLVNQVCDLVQIRSRPEGTVVRVTMSLR